MVQLSLSDEDKPDEFSSECCPKINAGKWLLGSHKNRGPESLGGNVCACLIMQVWSFNVTVSVK